MADMQSVQHGAAPERSSNFQKLTNMAGAAVSLALIVGIGVWGYKILVRDVSGVPVVKAAEGPIRVQPEDPGGQKALHQGFAVNDVAAKGTASKPADRLVLAPEPLDLTLEDQPITQIEQVSSPEPTQSAEDLIPSEASPQAEANEPVPSSPEDDTRLAALQLLADQLSEGVPPIQASPELTAEQEEPALTQPNAAVVPEPEPAIAVTEPGLARSLRPKARPARIASVEEAVAQAVAARAEPPVDPEKIPSGTRLAQLGAYESAAVAEKEWERLSGRFDEYLADKTRVIQKAQSGGRTFYRLRAMGFADLSDARRFCSALVAEKAECIPVVTR
ncbi:SPOR domain-containing protein [Roseovarius aestuariivivens]|uniref:SPOR domain-containing protein n=1 Tax=Roseovarius aestuariivivens TaxID=1888910 RepID=UPI001082157C|nr:SPOR domain-containing protein [Roseovarius aestuariivivens]